MVSESAMEALLSKLEAFPPVFDMIEAFGERTGPSNESLGGIHVNQRRNGQTGAIIFPSLVRIYNDNIHR